MKLTSLKCNNCGAPLDFELDNIIAFCPYCGQKLLFDTKQIDAIIIEKEKTKQAKYSADVEIKKQEEETKRKKEENDRKDARESNILGLVVFIIAMIMALSKGNVF